jgi:hypothetical protein
MTGVIFQNKLSRDESKILFNTQQFQHFDLLRFQLNLAGILIAKPNFIRKYCLVANNKTKWSLHIF